jgi:hypothetical protein
MFDYARFRWRLWRIERARRWTERAYDRDIAEAKAGKLGKDGKKQDLERIADTAHWEDLTYGDEVMRLHSRYFVRKANRLHVPIPSHKDEERWQEQAGYYWLTTKGLNEVRAAIRTEKKQRWELVLMWVPLATALTGVLGALIGFLATVGISLWHK